MNRSQVLPQGFIHERRTPRGDGYKRAIFLEASDGLLRGGREFFIVVEQCSVYIKKTIFDIMTLLFLVME